MASYEEMLLATLRDPPDPNESLPTINRKATIDGLIITFLIICWLAVLFRLWVRIRVVREPGWDDAFVLLAMLCATASATCVCISVEHGLGQHMLYIGPQNLQMYLKLFYLENGLYLTQTSFIKISLLLQFLRIFKAGPMRWACIILLTLVSIWGLGFFIIGWFSCFPVRGAWDRNIGARCYGFGLGDVQEFIAIYKAHSASNMVFDIAIFLTPLVLFTRPSLKRRSLLAMAGVFLFGATVVATSIWRLYSIIHHQAGTYPYMDFTWWTPPAIVLSCVEVGLAMMCASMPIFWPVIEQRLAAIFVSYEVRVTEENYGDYGLAYELEHTKSRQAESLKSHGGTSIEILTRDEPDGQKGPAYSIGTDPLAEESRYGNGFQASVQTKRKQNWEI